MGRTARGHTPTEHDGEIPPPPRSQQTPADEADLTHLSYVMRMVCWQAYDGRLEEGARQALLDALGHSPDCVAPDHYRKVWQEEREARERAEREREELRACVRRVEAERDSQAEKRQRAEREFGRLHSTYLEIAEALRVNHDRTDRLREALQVATDSLSYVLLRCRQMGLDVGRDVSGESWLMPFANGMQPEYDILRRARTALSADADADAEPEPVRHLPHCAVCALPVGFLGEHGDSVTHLAPGLDPSRRRGAHAANLDHDPEPAYADAEPSRAEGDEYETVGGGGCEHMWWTDRRCIYCGAYRDAEGGRPREADPQGPSNGTGDASVDGGGDDGRSRAIEAALRSDPDPDCHYGIPRLRGLVARAIDAALAGGHVETAEAAQNGAERMYRLGMKHGRGKAEARVRELEAVLSLFAGLSEHCARFGITQTALVNVSLLDRAHAAWQGGGRA